jgi:hypothetical protein
MLSIAFVSKRDSVTGDGEKYKKRRFIIVLIA